jgi:hypothetical protein
LQVLLHSILNTTAFNHFVSFEYIFILNAILSDLLHYKTVDKLDLCLRENSMILKWFNHTNIIEYINKYTTISVGSTYFDFKSKKFDAK